MYTFDSQKERGSQQQLLGPVGVGRDFIEQGRVKLGSRSLEVGSEARGDGSDDDLEIAVHLGLRIDVEDRSLDDTGREQSLAKKVDRSGQAEHGSRTYSDGLTTVSLTPLTCLERLELEVGMM